MLSWVAVSQSIDANLYARSVLERIDPVPVYLGHPDAHKPGVAYGYIRHVSLGPAEVYAWMGKGKTAVMVKVLGVGDGGGRVFGEIRFACGCP